MNFWWKFGLMAATYAAAIAIGWHGHTWYDGYKEAGTEKTIIDDRVAGEVASNADAGKEVKKEADDDQKAKASDAVVEKHIETDKPSYACVVPAVGVRDLQQAVTTHTRTGKPN